MRFGDAVLVVGAIVVLWRYTRQLSAAVQDGRLPPGVSPLSDELEKYSKVHYDACMGALRDFARAYRLTFLHGGCSEDAARNLHAFRATAVRHMYQLRMRLPNDLDAETRLTQHIDDVDSILRAYVHEAQERCGLSLLHPHPLDDSFYRRYYRAHNDLAR